MKTVQVVSFPKSAASPRPRRRGSMVFLTPEEMLALVKAAREHSTRAWAMILLGYRHGMRASEACWLKLADVDLKAGAITIRRLKGSVQTTQPLFPHRGQPLMDECAALRAWMRVRPADGFRLPLHIAEGRETRPDGLLSPVPSNCGRRWPASRETDLHWSPEIAVKGGRLLGEMMNAADLGIGEMLAWLKGEAAYGRTHLEIAKGLLAASAETARIAPTFFELTLDAHLQAAQMYVAKLYDKQRQAVTATDLVDRADQLAATFPLAKPETVREIVQIARAAIAELEPRLNAVQIRRNEYLAHRAVRTIRDLESMNSRATLTISDLDFVLVETTNILNLFSQALDGTLSIPMPLGSDDYKNVLKLCRP